MADRNWESIQSCFCDQAGMDVDLEAEVIYPADHLTTRIRDWRTSLFQYSDVQSIQSGCLHLGRNEFGRGSI